MKKNDIARAHAEPSNWAIMSNNGTTLVAQATFSAGTVGAFGTIAAELL